MLASKIKKGTDCAWVRQSRKGVSRKEAVLNLFILVNYVRKLIMKIIFYVKY